MFAFAFFYCFIFLLIFGYPLPTPWARFAPFWIDFGAIWGSTFPALSAARAELLQRRRKKLRKKLAENLQRTSKQLTRNAKNLQRTSNKLMQRTFPKSKIANSEFISSTRQQPQQTSSYKRGGGGTRACALGYLRRHPRSGVLSP